MSNFARIVLVTVFCFGLWACETTPTQEAKLSPSGLANLSAAEQAAFKSALLNLSDGRAAQAEQTLLKLVNTNKGVPEFWVNLALSQYHQKKYTQLSDTLKAMERNQLQTAPTYNLAGLVAVAEGDFKLAQEHYKRALDLNSDYSNALFNMALLQDVYLQNVKLALFYYERYLKLNSDDEETKNWYDHLTRSIGE